MQSQSKNLLNKANKAFKDYVNKAELIPYKRTYTNTGYNYIIPDTKNLKIIDCAINFSVDYTLSENIGYFKGIRVTIDTQYKIIGNYYMHYQDMIVFLNGYSSYTETMGQYQYEGVALRNDRVKLLDINLTNNTYGFSSLDIIIGIPSYVVLPRYETLSSKTFNEGVILADVVAQESLCLSQYSDISIDHPMVDDLRFTLINMTRVEAAKFLKSLMDYSLMSKEFGIISNPILKEGHDYDDVSNLRSILYEIEVKVSYNISIKLEETQKYIKNVIFRVSSAE